MDEEDPEMLSFEDIQPPLSVFPYQQTCVGLYDHKRKKIIQVVPEYVPRSSKQNHNNTVCITREWKVAHVPDAHFCLTFTNNMMFWVDVMFTLGPDTKTRFYLPPRYKMSLPEYYPVDNEGVSGSAQHLFFPTNKNVQMIVEFWPIQRPLVSGPDIPKKPIIFRNDIIAKRLTHMPTEVHKIQMVPRDALVKQGIISLTSAEKLALKRSAEATKVNMFMAEWETAHEALKRKWANGDKPLKEAPTLELENFLVKVKKENLRDKDREVLHDILKMYYAHFQNESAKRVKNESAVKTATLQ